jgi:hypothetical protein
VISSAARAELDDTAEACSPRPPVRGPPGGRLSAREDRHLPCESGDLEDAKDKPGAGDNAELRPGRGRAFADDYERRHRRAIAEHRVAHIRDHDGEALLDSRY